MMFVFGVGKTMPAVDFFLDLEPDEAVGRLAMIAREADQAGDPNFEAGSWEADVYQTIERARRR